MDYPHSQFRYKTKGLFVDYSAVNPRISSLGAYLLFAFLHGGLYEEKDYAKVTQYIFMVVGYIPVMFSLPINYYKYKQ